MVVGVGIKAGSPHYRGAFLLGIKMVNRKFKFDVVIGNPPYQGVNHGGNKVWAPPIYHKFMDETYKISSIVEFITPARFLFNAGATPKAWNRKMLSDKHLRVLFYERKSAKVFSNVGINGGIAVTCRDNSKELTPIGFYIPFKDLNSIKNKVMSSMDFDTFSKIVSPSVLYRFTDKMHEDYPDARERLSKGHDYDVTSNVFVNLNNIFHNDMPTDGFNYIRILGRENGNRTYKYIREDYIKNCKSLDAYKVIIPHSYGGRVLGELGTPLIEKPLTGHTDTFLSIGSYTKRIEALNTLKYIKTKFARVMLGIKKITQSNVANKWEYVPLQDFTANSDIDWTKSISEIDQQLYKKYGLDKKEIEFVETKVKEMK